MNSPKMKTILYFSSYFKHLILFNFPFVFSIYFHRFYSFDRNFSFPPSFPKIFFSEHSKTVLFNIKTQIYKMFAFQESSQTKFGAIYRHLHKIPHRKNGPFTKFHFLKTTPSQNYVSKKRLLHKISLCEIGLYTKFSHMKTAFSQKNIVKASIIKDIMNELCIKL